ncbi:MAG: hypothetical protein U5K79_24620 [Cyclobacteriaceae bacterium]|nr:hypothetical protein [Cyclobacteriaceae bacterium]
MAYKTFKYIYLYHDKTLDSQELSRSWVGSTNAIHEALGQSGSIKAPERYTIEDFPKQIGHSLNYKGAALLVSQGILVLTATWCGGLMENYYVSPP